MGTRNRFRLIASIMMLVAVLLSQSAAISATESLTLLDSDGDVLAAADIAEGATRKQDPVLPLATASFPFYDGFESGTLGPDWTTYTTAEGRVQVSSSYPYSGSYSLLLDDSQDNSTYSYAAAILTIDLSGQSQVELDFWWREFSDEDNNDDGVFFSDDWGTTWVTATNFTGGQSSFEHEVVDVDAVAAANGLTLNDHFQVKFQFYDNYSINQDGYAIDEVRVQQRSYKLYLPLALKNAGPPSSPPVLDDISNPDGARSYTVSWSSVSGATKYVLEEDDNASFTSPTVVYSGANTSTTITGRNVGTYYYRVKATNSLGSSPWSNVVSTTVTQTAVVPKPGYWSGGSVSFEVSSDSSTVDWFELDVYVSGCGWYTLTWYDMAITDGQFSKGEFTTPTSASGSCSYFFQACNGWVFGWTSWSATWQHY